MLLLKTSPRYYSFANDVEFMTGSRPNIFWMVCWKYISPLSIFVIFVANVAKQASGTYTYNAYVGCLEVRIFYGQPLASVDKRSGSRCIYRCS